MELSRTEIEELNKKILQSKMRLLVKNGFYGLLLEHLRFYLEEDCETAYTDGRKIVFGVEFLRHLSDQEVDFIMMHEIGHIVLKHCFRGLDYDSDGFNIACDMVVNSIILKEANFDEKAITVNPYGVSMHKFGNKEGCDFTAEEMYSFLFGKSKRKSTSDDDPIGDGDADDNSKSKSGHKKPTNGNGIDGVIDDHSKWDRGKNPDQYEELEQELNQTIINVAKLMKDKQKALGCGGGSALAEIALGEFKKPQVNWREMLDNFIQEEIVDYSFTPPDKRMQDSPFFLPDFNEADITAKDVLFMVDTSGSMNQESVTKCFSEIKGAIDQFDGKLKGWVGFFDDKVAKPQPFDSVDSLLQIKPVGGGGTSFINMFNYINEKLDFTPTSIIVLTDGYAEYPDKDITDIPVLWVIQGDFLDFDPPLGKVTHID